MDSCLSFDHHSKAPGQSGLQNYLIHICQDNEILLGSTERVSDLFKTTDQIETPNIQILDYLKSQQFWLKRSFDLMTIDISQVRPVTNEIFQGSWCFWKQLPNPYNLTIVVRQQNEKRAGCRCSYDFTSFTGIIDRIISISLKANLDQFWRLALVITAASELFAMGAITIEVGVADFLDGKNEDWIVDIMRQLGFSLGKNQSNQEIFTCSPSFGDRPFNAFDQEGFYAWNSLCSQRTQIQTELRSLLQHEDCQDLLKVSMSAEYTRCENEQAQNQIPEFTKESSIQVLEEVLRLNLKVLDVSFTGVKFLVLNFHPDIVVYVSAQDQRYHVTFLLRCFDLYINGSNNIVIFLPASKLIDNDFYEQMVKPITRQIFSLDKSWVLILFLQRTLSRRYDQDSNAAKSHSISPRKTGML